MHASSSIHQRHNNVLPNNFYIPQLTLTYSLFVAALGGDLGHIMKETQNDKIGQHVEVDADEKNTATTAKPKPKPGNTRTAFTVVPFAILMIVIGCGAIGSIWFTGVPKTPQMHAVITNVRFAKSNAGKDAETAVLATICNIGPSKNTYILQTIVTDGTVNNFRYRIKGYSCADVVLRSNAESDYTNCEMFLYERVSYLMGTFTTHYFRDTYLAIAT